MNKQMEGFSFFLSYLYLAVTKYNISGELKIHSRLVCSLCPHPLRLKGKKQKSHKLPNEQSKTHITHLHLNRFFWLVQTQSHVGVFSLILRKSNIHCLLFFFLFKRLLKQVFFFYHQYINSPSFSIKQHYYVNMLY